MRYLRYFLPARVLLLVALTCLLAPSLAGQGPTQTLIVMPFENQSSAPGLEWITESFPEVLLERMSSPTLYVLSRDDRTYAFDRSGIPSSVMPSRASMYRVAEQMDADFVVMGSYNFDGKTFTAQAQLLDMKKLHMYPQVDTNGPLTSLIDLESMLAWELMQQLPSRPPMTREQFLRASPPIRLDAFENYIRGTLAASHQQKIHYFHDALKLNPNYTLAMLQLGKTYFATREYESASNWLARVPRNDPAAGEANFLLGMSEFYRGNYDRAFTAFSYVLTRAPLAEVYNNLGVVEARRGHRGPAVEYFTKAANADPSDPDYRFNLAVALFRNGDPASAGRQVREVLQQRPSDGEAKSLLETINRGTVPPVTAAAGTSSLLTTTQPRIPLERIKRNYDEASYRQLEMQIRNLNEARLAGMTNHDHAAYHLQRGKELLSQNLTEQAESEFRDAVAAEPSSAAAHAQLASVLEKKGDINGARAEAQNSIRLKPNVDALLVLARLDLKQNQFQAAAAGADRALTLEPNNAAALALKRDIAARQTGAK